MRKIYLANNKGIALVDDEDYDWLNEYKWHINIGGYAETKIKINNKWFNKFMHRILIEPPKNMFVDHIDHNKLNNKKNNLRIATKSQNSMNRPKYNGTSKYKGVCWDKRKNKYISEIMLNNKTYYLGEFMNEIDAAKAYNKKAIELHGEYAYLNEV